jgi:uncharacterized LabA/DUF88 family protein
LIAGDCRRWLILRCYLNPSGSVPHRGDAGTQTRLFFSGFRTSFVRAGFEVIDCPRYSGTKNAADIRIVVDAIDALADDARYDEFVIASGDSDMTPLLHRLRRADRRTMIVPRRTPQPRSRRRRPHLGQPAGGRAGTRRDGGHQR